jgi:putative addiction module component (TIGR02574 family)
MNHLDIAALPVAEKLQLMESLWDSLCREDAEAPTVPAWHQEVLAERLSRLDSGEEPLSTWQDAKKRIREQTEGR